jgi:protein-S-isoprenylcysteine O-methyltransferase Ste14
MHDEIFRLVLAIGLVVTLPVGLYYRVRSQRTREPLDRRQEGLLVLFTLRPIGLTGILGVLTFIANPRWMTWSSVSLPASARWAGAVIGALALALFIWTFRNLGSNITDTVVTRKHHTLIRTGPYHFIRHPFYIATGLTVLASSLTTANWFVGLAGVLAVALLVIRTITEEAYLARRFGNGYSEYCEQTGQFLPRIKFSSRMQ